MEPSEAHIARVRQELQNAGITSFGRLRFSCRHLPAVIHEEEHVMAAIYGRYHEGGGLLSLSEGVLVATSHRIIFLDHKPGYTKLDELGYDLVVGIRHSKAGPFSAVTIHTRIGDFTVRFCKHAQADRFVHYVETRGRLETTSNGNRVVAPILGKEKHE